MFPKKIKAIRVSQPFGEFFLCNIKADELLEVTFSDPLRYEFSKHEDNEPILKGSQRQLKRERIIEIGRYIQTVEAAFPNAIILSANYQENGFLCEDAEKIWTVSKIEAYDIYEITIPTAEKLCSIIDGQHRLNGFLTVPNSYQDFELPCSIYFDLPNPYQAYLFATINFNQKNVDKSLAYEQFGFNLDDEKQSSWSPEKLAVFFARKLNGDKEEKTAFYNHIILAPQDDDILFTKKAKETEWAISTSTVVDSIMRLISSNPKRDKYELHKYSVDVRDRKILKPDNSPFRDLYIATRDAVIYKSIVNFFNVVNDLLFIQSKPTSYIKKTVGIQALFDLHREISIRTLNSQKDISYDFYKGYIDKVRHVDFSNNFFQASGVGRSRIKNILFYANGFIKENSLKEALIQIESLLNTRS